MCVLWSEWSWWYWWVGRSQPSLVGAAQHWSVPTSGSGHTLTQPGPALSILSLTTPVSLLSYPVSAASSRSSSPYCWSELILFSEECDSVLCVDSVLVKLDILTAASVATATQNIVGLVSPGDTGAGWELSRQAGSVRVSAGRESRGWRHPSLVFPAAQTTLPWSHPVFSLQ